VVPAPDRDVLHVEDLRDVVGMDPFEVEGDDPGSPFGGRSVDDEIGNLGEAVERVRHELVLVLLDGV
jgi:hypothetical protein